MSATPRAINNSLGHHCAMMFLESGESTLAIQSSAQMAPAKNLVRNSDCVLGVLLMTPAS